MCFITFNKGYAVFPSLEIKFLPINIFLSIYDFFFCEIFEPQRVNPNHTTKIWVGKRPAQAFQIHKLYIIQIVLDLPNFLTEYGACVQKNITNKIIPVRNQFSC